MYVRMSLCMSKESFFVDLNSYNLKNWGHILPLLLFKNVPTKLHI